MKVNERENNVSTVRISRAEATIPGETVRKEVPGRQNIKGLITVKIGTRRTKTHLIEGEEE